MQQVKVTMPKMGEGVLEATVINWLREVGDTVEAEEALVEIATDKVDTEIVAPYSGVIVERFFQKDDVIRVGDTVAVIETEDQIEQEGDVPENTDEIVSGDTENRPFDETVFDREIKNTTRFYSPLVKSIARVEKVSIEELETIKGTGAGGRVTKDDILLYVQKRREGKIAPVRPKSQGDELIEMSRIRRIIAENMLKSVQTSPHVTSITDADVTSLAQWRDSVKEEFRRKYGEKLTFTPIFVSIVSRALREYGMVNVSVQDDKIIKHNDINIGLAVALPSGDLIVPVIRHADTLSLHELAFKVNDLAKRARENKLKPDEIQGGTYTITNVGSFDTLIGMPIIMQPQAAILALGAIKKVPTVIETPEGDFLGIRQKMYLSHTYDHRVIDGALGGNFVRRVVELIENWRAGMEEGSDSFRM